MTSTSNYYFWFRFRRLVFKVVTKNRNNTTLFFGEQSHCQPDRLPRYYPRQAIPHKGPLNNNVERAMLPLCYDPAHTDNMRRKQKILRDTPTRFKCQSQLCLWSRSPVMFLDSIRIVNRPTSVLGLRFMFIYFIFTQILMILV